MTQRAALAFEEREYTAAQLDALAEGLARVLTSRGVHAGDRMALMSSNRPEFVVGVLAAWRVEAAVVLISPAWKQGEVEHALSVTEPVLGMGDQPVLAGLIDTVDLDDPITPVEPVEPVARTVREDADAVLVFSSGTTGLPKAVRHTHGSLAAAVGHWRAALELTDADRMQVATPPSHILGLLNIVTCLEAGVWFRMHRRFDLDTVLRTIELDRITVEMAVAPIALAIAHHPDLESFDLSSLRYIMWGATPVTESVARTVTRRTGVPWVPAYGASELPVIACNPVREARLDSVGRTPRGVQARIVDLETGEPLPPGATGEIQVRSASLMAGYLPASATVDALDHGWYRTGDVGDLDADGWLRITDRSKEMVKVRGFQVAPAEVEGVLLGHPHVQDVAVYGVPHQQDGEALVAAVVLSAAVEPAELIGWVAERLASYKKPREVLLVPEIPRLPSGKALRRVLKERHGRSPVG